METARSTGDTGASEQLSSESGAGRRGCATPAEQALREMSGFECAYLLVDRESGKALTITLWESEDALRESEERANQLRSQVAEDLGATGTPTIDRYAVAGVIEK